MKVDISMCGIAGRIGAAPAAEDVKGTVRRMRDLLAHRGPDGEGEFFAANAALAMRRLAIVDLSGGMQPLYNEDRSLALVANGEIYNHVELRERLASRGHAFATNSDCETILHAYEDEGPECLARLRGMFAFALWDGPRRRLFLARDRMGEKPLYLAEREGSLFFASELKALVGAGVVPFNLDPGAVDLYFHYGYVPEPRTAVKGVRKLPAGHFLLVETDPWRIEERCYWRMEDAPPLDGDPASLIRGILGEVHGLVIRADVPVGVALSGGLDSGAVAALASRNYPGTMRAFGVGYPGSPACDERAEARALAETLGLPFHSIEIAASDVAADFPRLAAARDDPIADPAGPGYDAVARLARAEGVPVLLFGQGGDELFWGYDWVRRAARESFEKRALHENGCPSRLRYLRPSPPEVPSLRGLASWARDGFGIRSGLRRRRRHWEEPDRLVFYDLAPDFLGARAGLRSAYAPAFAEMLEAEAPFAPFTRRRPWKELPVTLTALIARTYLAENGIAQGDRLSMAHSVELRLPLVDHRLVETVVGLRKRQDDHALPPKAWLRAALRGVLPDAVLDRPKRGFAPPSREWHQAIFAGRGRMLEDGLLVERGVLKSEAARDLARGEFPEGSVLPLSFKALVLEAWGRGLAEAGVAKAGRADRARAPGA